MLKDRKFSLSGLEFELSDPGVINPRAQLLSQTHPGVINPRPQLLSQTHPGTHTHSAAPDIEVQGVCVVVCVVVD